ncbi:MAG: hypothetical protein RLY67_955 [Pseudomonadota bacterium]
MLFRWELPFCGGPLRALEGAKNGAALVQFNVVVEDIAFNHTAIAQLDQLGLHIAMHCARDLDAVAPDIAMNASLPANDQGHLRVLPRGHQIANEVPIDSGIGAQLQVALEARGSVDDGGIGLAGEDVFLGGHKAVEFHDFWFPYLLRKVFKEQVHLVPIGHAGPFK